MATSTQSGTETKGGGDPAFPPFDSSNFASTILWLVITFGALYLIMSRLALPRVKTILADRSHKIHGDLAAARQMRKEANEAAAAYEKTLADARANSQALAAETRAKVKLEQENKRQALEAELNQKLQTAEAQIAEAQVAAMQNVGQIAGEAATAIVEQFTGKPADPAAIAQAMAEVRA